MNPDDPQALLAQLEPIVTPPPVGFWPPAPGWWLLLLVLLVAIGATITWLVSKYRRASYRRHALAELDKLDPESSSRYAMQVDALLKRAALQAYPNDAHQIASLHGQKWLGYLQAAVPRWQPQEAPLVLTESLYQPSPQFNYSRLEAEARQWLKLHRPSRAGGGRNV